MSFSSEHCSFVDTHFHAGPDLYVRRWTVGAAGLHYAASGGWVVVKSHLGSTAAQAWEARQDGGAVSGSVVLNAIAGGVSSRSVEQAVWQHGSDARVRLIVYLPTLREHTGSASRLRRVPFLADGPARASEPEPLCDTDGALRREIAEVLRSARDLPVVVATGHANRDETLRIVELAVSLGLDRLLLTHPASPCCGLSPAELRDLGAHEAIYVEITALERLLGHHTPSAYSDLLRCNTRVIHSSDLGQPDQPGLNEWLQLRARWFDEAALSAAERLAVTATNAKRLLAW